MSTAKDPTDKVSEGCAAPARRRSRQLQSATGADVQGARGGVGRSPAPSLFASWLVQHGVSR
jgi:hypothetical protein